MLQDLNIVITVSADVLALIGGRPSVDTGESFFKVCLVITYSWYICFCSDNIIQNDRWDPFRHDGSSAE